MNDASIIHDAVVVGGGPAGLAAAIALTDAGAKTALLARRAPYADNRTTALLGASVDLLDRLGVWAGCIDRAKSLAQGRRDQLLSIAFLPGRTVEDLRHADAGCASEAVHRLSSLGR